MSSEIFSAILHRPRGKRRRYDLLNAARWAIRCRWASAAAADRRGYDPVVDLALFAADPNNLSELRFAANMEVARYLYPSFPRFDDHDLACLWFELRRRFRYADILKASQNHLRRQSDPQPR